MDGWAARSGLGRVLQPGAISKALVAHRRAVLPPWSMAKNNPLQDRLTKTESTATDIAAQRPVLCVDLSARAGYLRSRLGSPQHTLVDACQRWSAHQHHGHFELAPQNLDNSRHTRGARDAQSPQIGPSDLYRGR